MRPRPQPLALAPRRARRARRRTQGFTLIEVMMAVSILLVGALGIMALSQSAVQGNVQAREMTVATDVTRLWVERLHRDAVRWNQKGTTGLLTTQYLRTAPASAAAPGAWAAPVPPPGPDSRSFDFFGADTPAASAYYCTDIRLSWVVNQEAIRADVRTYWHRTDVATDRRLFVGCGTPAAVSADLDSAAPHLKAVYGSTVLRWTRLPEAT